MGGSAVTHSGGPSGGFGRAFGGGLAWPPAAPDDEDASPPLGADGAFGSGAGGGVGLASAFLLSSSAVDCCWFIITIGAGSHAGGTPCAGGYLPSLGSKGVSQPSMWSTSEAPWATWLADVVVM